MLKNVNKEVFKGIKRYAKYVLNKIIKMQLLSVTIEYLKTFKLKLRRNKLKISKIYKLDNLN